LVPGGPTENSLPVFTADLAAHCAPIDFGRAGNSAIQLQCD
jgi:hypothetical protein